MLVFDTVRVGVYNMGFKYQVVIEQSAKIMTYITAINVFLRYIRRRKIW